MNIYGEKVMLRAIEPEDLEMLREIINDPETEKMVGGWSFPVSKVEQEKWFEKISGDRNNIRLIIEIQETGESIGMISLTDIDWKNRSAFNGIKLKSSAPKRKGYATDAVMAIEWYSFEQLQLNRLDGAWLEDNVASERLYIKCGWKIEGTKMSAIFKNGKYHNQHFTGILRDEFIETACKMNWKKYSK